MTLKGESFEAPPDTVEQMIYMINGVRVMAGSSALTPPEIRERVVQAVLATTGPMYTGTADHAWEASMELAWVVLKSVFGDLPTGKVN